MGSPQAGPPFASFIIMTGKLVIETGSEADSTTHQATTSSLVT